MRILLSLVLVLGLASSPAQAQTTPGPNEERARELYQNGEMLYEEGRYDDAIAAWQEAYRLSEKAPLLFNIANAQERLGHYQDALDTLGRYRAYAPLEEREMLDRRIVNLERRLQEAGPVTAQPPIATTPPQVATPPQPMPPVVEKDKKFPVVPVVLYAVGAGGLGTGVVFGLQARAARVEAEGLCTTSGGDLLCPGTAGDALARDKRFSFIADIGFGVGALAVAGGIVTTLVDDSGWHLTPGFGSLALSGRF